MEIRTEEPPCAGHWFSFWIVGATGKTKIQARVDGKKISTTECSDHPCHELIQIPDRTDNRMLRINATDSAGTTCERQFAIQAGKPRPELTALTPDNAQASDAARFPYMTGWFAPVLLAKLLLKVIISDVFGQYARKRGRDLGPASQFPRDRPLAGFARSAAAPFRAARHSIARTQCHFARGRLCAGVRGKAACISRNGRGAAGGRARVEGPRAVSCARGRPALAARVRQCERCAAACRSR